MRVSVWMAVLAGTATLAASIPASAQIGPNNSQADTMGRRMIPQGGPGGGIGNRGGFRGNPGGFAGNRGGFGGNRGGFNGGYGRGGYAGYRHHDRGYGVGAGIAGLAAGALIGGAIASQSNPGYGYGYDGGYVDPGYAPDYGYAAPAPGYAYAPAAAPADDGGQEAYCAQRYKSYDPSSGTYLGYDGARHPCP